MPKRQAATPSREGDASFPKALDGFARGTERIGERFTRTRDVLLGSSDASSDITCALRDESLARCVAIQYPCTWGQFNIRAGV